MAHHPSEVESKFDAWSQSGDAERMAKSHGPYAKQGFDALQIQPGERYLDIGCGNGYSLRWAADVAPSVAAFGMDISAGMITRAEALCSDYKNIEVAQGTWPDSSVEDASFDAVFSMEVFYYLGDLGEALRHVYRVLRPGGRFACLVDFYQENTASHEWPTRMNLSMHLLSASEWKVQFKRVGFEPVTSRQLTLKSNPDFCGTLLTLGTKLS